MPTLASSNPPEMQQYIAAFQAVNNLTDNQIQMLKIHYDAPEQTITAKQLSQAMGYSHHATANMMYGRLGTSKQKNTQLLLVGWATREPVAKGAHVAHPTRLDNLFFGSPLARLVGEQLGYRPQAEKLGTLVTFTAYFRNY